MRLVAIEQTVPPFPECGPALQQAYGWHARFANQRAGIEQGANSIEWTAEQVAEEYEGDQAILATMTDGFPVGIAHYRLLPANEDIDAEHVKAEGLMVVQGLRGHGFVGSFLLHQMLLVAARHDITAVAANCYPEVVPFYQRHSYEVIKEAMTKWDHPLVSRHIGPKEMVDLKREAAASTMSHRPGDA